MNHLAAPQPTADAVRGPAAGVARAVVASPGAIRIEELGTGALCWVYLGDDLARAASVRARLGPDANEIALAEQIKRAAQTLRQEYIDYVGALGRTHGSPRWWTSCVSDKNPSQSRAFFFACCVVAVREAIGGMAEGGTLLLVVEEPALRDALADNLQAWACPTLVQQRRREPWAARAREIVEVLGRLVYHGAEHVGRILLARYYYRLHRTPAVRAAIHARQPISVTHAWVDRRACHVETGEFEDADFGELGRWLEARGATVFTAPNVLAAVSYRRVLRWVARAGRRHLVPHAFLRPRDVLACLLQVIAEAPRRRRFPDFAGVRMDGLLHYDARREWRAFGRFPALLLARWFARWQEAGLEVERFVYTFENKLWERAACLAFRAAYPRGRLIAHQPNGLPLLYLNYSMAVSEHDILPLPDRIVSNGRHGERVLLASGFPADRVVCGGGLRQRYLDRYLDGVASLRPRGRRSERPHVLVTPSISREEHLDLITKCVQAFATSTDFSVVIKCHPSMPFERFSAQLGRPLPSHIEVSSEPIGALLPTGDVLLYNGTAFPAVEALAVGVPVIYVEPSFGLCIDNLDCYPQLRSVARDPASVLARVRQALAQQHISPQSTGERARVLRELVGKVDERVFELFV